MSVLVTGATSGFGLAIARRFAEAGYPVVAAGRRKERLQTLAAELGRDRVLALVLDVRDRHAVETAIAALPPGFADIDVLVNNAGLAVGLEPAYRYRIGAVPGDPALDAVERQLSASPKITAPTVVIQGADEGVDPPEALDISAPHFTQLRRTMVLKGVGHNAPQEAPAAYAAAVLSGDA